MKIIMIASLIASIIVLNVKATPGGTYTLTGDEKSVSEIIEADMKQFPEFYKGESLSGYIKKFKRENKVGQRKFSAGDQLRFPETFASIKLKKKLRAEQKKNMEKAKASYKIAKKYLKHCRSSNNPIPLGNFGWNEVREYWSKVPELQALRDTFNKADNELRNVLMQDKEYRLAMEKFKTAVREDPTGEDRKANSKYFSQSKNKVYKRLMKKSKAYRNAREKRDEALFTSNIETLEYIINDYEKQGKEFPVDWIGKY